MDKKTLSKYLLCSNVTTATVNDVYFNNVDLLLRLDNSLNTLGLPFYKDYSTKQRQFRYFIGSSSQSDIAFININDSDYSNYPDINANLTSNNKVNSFLTIPNKYNHTLRVAELNSGTLYGSIKGTFLEMMLNGQQPINFGTNDWTIEFSFYADSVTLPWKYQPIINYADCFAPADNLTIATINSYTYVTGLGYSIFLANNVLTFYDSSNQYIIANNITANTWYHVCLQRNGNVLETYINFNLVNSYTNYTHNFNYSVGVNANTTGARLSIGGSNYFRTFSNYWNTTEGIYYVNNNQVELTFSGGLANIRITTGISRYKQSFYSCSLPFYITSIANPIDNYYNYVLANFPFLYDLYYYSPYQTHLNNPSLLELTPNYITGFVELDGKNVYSRNPINTNLSNTNWTIEFYLTYFHNGVPYKGFNPGYSVATGNNNYPQLTANQQISKVPTTGFGVYVDSTMNVLNLTSGTSVNNKILTINLRWLYEAESYGYNDGYDVGGYYLGLKISEDGTNWLANVSPTLIYWDGDSRGTATIPTNELVLYRHDNYNNNTITVNSGYEEAQTHIAIERFNNYLYVFINGNLANTIPFNYTLFSVTNSLGLSSNSNSYPTITCNSVNDGINEGIYNLTVGIKGLRITNQARYSTTTSNEYFAYDNIFNLPLSTNVITEPRARIIAILCTSTLASVSTTTVSWNIYLSQEVDTLTTDDFSLTQLQGVTGASIVSLTKNNNYVYTLVANTGSGNGILGLNFLDRKTLKFSGTNILISNYAGELSFQGNQYTINKSNPLPILTSGSNPYINSSFLVTITFNAAIATFDPTKIGVENGTITNTSTITIGSVYQITVQPIKEAPVIVQCMQGTGVTDSNITSAISASLVRIYSSSFPILQLPLDTANTVYDLSPARLTLTPVIANQITFDTTTYPFGETSSLQVQPTNEQSGLVYTGFNAIGSDNTTTAGTSYDWTIEFFLRIDSSNNKSSHIFSIENSSTGICFFSSNKQLLIYRSVTNTTQLFSGLSYPDLDTGNFIALGTAGYSLQQLYPHFAVTCQSGVYRFYRNGIRIALIVATPGIDVTRGDIKVGYYQNRITDCNYWLSNIRVTLGQALYTAASVDIPGLPYTVLENITDATNLLNYISIYSDNYNSNLATINNVITVKYSSIINLVNIPTVTINNIIANTSYSNNYYYSTVTVDNTYSNGIVNFSIAISNEPNLPNKVFSSTTDNSYVDIMLSALNCTVYTNEPNDNSYQFDIFISFNNNTLNPLTLDLLNVSNGIASNLFSYPNQNLYKVTIVASSSGNVSIYLPANTMQDLAGNYNSISNTLTRTTVVPAYIPDQYFSNVIFLLQPTINIIDESNTNTSITVNNVTLTSQNSPVGLSKSMLFNGTNSSLLFNLNQSLPSTINYTIEFYAYIQSSSILRLTQPVLLPSSSVTTNSFQANWNIVTNAENYQIDVSTESNFDTYVPGYESLNTGNVTDIIIGNINSTSVPVFDVNNFIGSKGFAQRIIYDVDTNIGYYYDIALDNNFNNILYEYNERFINSNTITAGNLSKLSYIGNNSNTNSSNSNSSQSTLGNGTLITGLLTQSNYPQLLYILEESSVRLYNESGYTIPAIIEDISVSTWTHIALVNVVDIYGNGTCNLYRNGSLEDSIKNVSWSNVSTSLGYYLGYISALISGIRITKGIARYLQPFTPPSLPYPTS